MISLFLLSNTLIQDLLQQNINGKLNILEITIRNTYAFYFPAYMTEKLHTYI